MKRLNRLTYCFSKKLRNLEAAFAMFAAYYNFCWQTRKPGKSGKKRSTAAMMAGLAGHVWSFDELFGDGALACYNAGMSDRPAPDAPAKNLQGQRLERWWARVGASASIVAGLVLLVLTPWVESDRYMNPAFIWWPVGVGMFLAGLVARYALGRLR